jgi:DNA-binding beta-propeller fold protein YncE
VNGETRDSGETPGTAQIIAGGEFAGHRIVAELGRGGMGVVYRAHDPVLDRDRALKVIVPALSADPRFRERFRRESRLAAQVDHPNLIPIYRAGEEAGQLFLVMRLVEGVDLRSEVAENGPLAPPRAARIVSELGAALDAAHARGLVHRDVKPANVLIESTDGAERVFLTDFGISRSATGSGTITGSGEVMGSLDYVAPEQLEGAEVDRRADIYSLGCVAFFTLTGEPPFPRDSDVAKMYAHVNAPRPRASELAPNLTAAIDEVIARALAVEPDRRPATAGELGADLEEAIAGVHEATTTRVPRRRPRARPAGKPGRRLGGRRGRLAIAGSIVVAIAAAAAIVATSGGGAPSQPQVVATIDVGGGPNGVSVGPHLVWVAAHAAGEVVAIDPHSNRPVGPPIEVGGHPSSVAVAFGSVWVTDSSSGTLIRIKRHRIVQHIRVGSHPSDVVAANGFVWVANEASNSVNRIDPFGGSPSVSATVAVGGGPHALAIGDHGVWVASIRNGTVSEIDPRHATTEGRPIPAGRGPSDIAAGPDVIWAIDNVGGTLIRIDPKARTASRPTPVGRRPRGLKQGLGYLWVANGGDSTVWRLEQDTGARVGDPIEVGANPADISIGDGSVWTADYDAGSVTRINP